MFIRPTSAEMTLICRGVAAFLLVVVLGVSLAESQLNSMTKRNEFVQAINIKRDITGKYTAYLLGTEYSIRAVYDVARISANDRALAIEAAGHKFLIPKSINLSQFQALASIWRQQFLDEALTFKQTFAGYLKEIRQKINLYLEQYRHENR
ncbi:hypothetical protein SDC9_08981 [bioreactor metagenome]|uniref:Uncharacterized protein n=1 Tax=bioreactor metagenome TaxID=1076179 RepID=A0A644T8S7_9ZZZZ|nr:hypothetical protein [Negativicutes bacterium]